MDDMDDDSSASETYESTTTTTSSSQSCSTAVRKRNRMSSSSSSSSMSSSSSSQNNKQQASGNSGGGVGSSYDQISVCIRIRPLNERESKLNPISAWGTSNNSLYQCNAKTGAPVPGSTVYSFDHVYDSSTSTSTVYEQVAQRIVQSVVEGYNGTIFAYGQTSSGKTFTMKGTDQELGIISQSVFEVFDAVMRHPEREFTIRVSYLEIYNEVIMDLLEPESKNLKIHENFQRGIFVGDLKEQSVTSPDQILELMATGERHRHVGATNMNERSSRSHTIFRLVIESRLRMFTQSDGNDIDECESRSVRVATLNLVDLAGSERVQHTGSEGQRLVEGGHINKSLLTLGTVIGKLSEGSAHIPYRDSKLTRILQPALGGNSRTAIICTITPAAAHAEESLSTLKFASRAKSITNKAHINEIINEQNLVQKLKKEVTEWKHKYEAQTEVCERLSQQTTSLKNLLTSSESHSFELQQAIEQKTRLVSELSAQLKQQELELTRVHQQLRTREEHSEKEVAMAEQLRKQSEEFELEKMELIEQFELDKNDMVQQFIESEKELQARIDELEQEKSDFVVDNTGTYEKVNTLQRQIKELKTENQELRTKLQKRKRVAKNSTADGNPKRMCLVGGDGSAHQNTTIKQNDACGNDKENALVVAHK